MKAIGSIDELWGALNGIVCVHKPRDVSLMALKRRLVDGIVNGAARCVPPTRIPTVELPIVEPHPRTGALLVVGMRKQLDFSSHPLVVGSAIRSEDIHVEELHELSPASSGVCLMGVNEGCDQLESIRDRAWVNEYFLRGQLGRETVDNEIRGKVSRTCDFREVTHYRMQKMLGRIQAQFKRMSFELAGVDLQSQEAFELARKGTPRPKVLGQMLLCGLLLKSFKAPNFSLTVNCVSETDEQLRHFIRELAVTLGSTASCRQLRCVRVGPFDGEHSLLDKHFTLSNILANMRVCKGVLARDDDSADKSVLRHAARIPIGDVHEDRLVEVLGEDDEQDEEIEDCLRVPWGREYT